MRFLDPFPPGAQFTVARVAVALSTICAPAAIDDVALALIDPGKPVGGLVLTVPG